MTAPELPLPSQLEVQLLATLVGDGAAQRVSRAPGGWRTLSMAELETLQVSEKAREAILALQELTQRQVPSPIGEIGSPEAVARAYQARLGNLSMEVVVAVALNAQNHIIGEFEVSRGGRHGAALTPADVFHPLIRACASQFVLVHNHPSGSTEPSAEDKSMTSALAAVGELLGLPLVDHVIVTRDEFTSLYAMGLMSSR